MDQNGPFRVRAVAYVKNGEKALAFVTDPSRVAYIPTAEGSALLASAREPERLLASPRRLD